MENKSSKYLKYALGEIILVVIGILIALQVNNWNETRIEQHRIKDYAKSLIQDLRSDLTMLYVCLEQAELSYNSIDSLKRYMAATPVKDLSNTTLFILTNHDLYRPFMWNRSTFDELKSSGSVRFITNDSLENKLVQYEALARHLDEDFNGDKDRSTYAERLVAKVVNFNSPYFSKIIDYAEISSNKPYGYFQTPYFENSIKEDLPLVTYDEAQILELTNFYITIQGEMKIRAYLELPRIINDAKEIIALLKTEYGI